MALQHCVGRCAKSEINKIIILADDIEEREVKEKWCYKCRSFQPSNLDNFFSDTSSYDGLCNKCKKCDNIARVIRKQKRKDN